MKAKSGSDPLFGGQMLKHYRSLVGLPWGPDVGLRALELVSKGYSYGVTHVYYSAEVLRIFSRSPDILLA